VRVCGSDNGLRQQYGIRQADEKAGAVFEQQFEWDCHVEVTE
jgi:hypothetical protein